MKHKLHNMVVLLILLGLLAFAAPVSAQGPQPHVGGGVNIGGNTTVESGTVHDGGVLIGGNLTVREGGTVGDDIVMLGGNVRAEQSSKMQGNLVALGGNVLMAGTVSGNIVALGGNVHLTSSAVVQGDIQMQGGDLVRDEGAVVKGDITRGNGPRILLPPHLSFPPTITTRPATDGFGFFGGIIRALALAALGALVVVFFPNPLQRVSATVQQSFLPSLGVGCLTVMILPVLLVLLAITLVGIPMVIVIAIVGAAAWYFGWITIGYLAGERILQAAKVRDIAPIASVLVGVLIVALLGEVPCLGGIVSAVVGLLGLGAVVLTRFGTRLYPPMPLLAAPAPVAATPAAETLPPAPTTDDAPQG